MARASRGSGLITRFSRLNAIVDVAVAARAGWEPAELAAAYINGGARFLQLRAKSMPGAAFLRASGTSNHHDLGLFSVGPDAPRPERGRVGLYHLAWQVPSIHDIANARLELQRVGAYTGESDHGVSKSVYAQDPDGNEFEIMHMVPSEQWGEYEQHAVVQPLDLPAEIERFG